MNGWDVNHLLVEKEQGGHHEQSHVGRRIHGEVQQGQLLPDVKTGCQYHGKMDLPCDKEDDTGRDHEQRRGRSA